MESRSAQVASVAALAEPTRRRLYDHVVRQADPVGRDEAASATGVPRATVAFHLDRLVDDGLLEVVFERRSGRTGPGAGRPAKLYRRSKRAISVSLPERRYDLAGDLLAAAVVEAGGSGETTRAALDRLAYSRGRELSEAAGSPAEEPEGRAAALRVLEEHGYEPRAEGDVISLVNCPFHDLAQEHTELVCGMNLRLVDGLLDGIPSARLVAQLCPTRGRCCVRLLAEETPAVS